MNEQDRETLLVAAATLCCVGNSQNQPGIRLSGQRLMEIADRRQAVWPSDCATLKYDPFSKTWSLSGLSQELFHEEVCQILGDEPSEGLLVNVRIIVESIGEVCG